MDYPLLFFPSHSSRVLTLETDIKATCQTLKKIGKGFKTIRICMYWIDVLKEHHQYYQSQGFECVTAGNIMDPLFLSRLKSVIECADLTVSNVISSQVGFCVNLNKPHYILHQPVAISGDANLKKFYQKLYKSQNYQEIKKAFSKLNEVVTKQQLEVVDRYFGSQRHYKKPKEFQKIVDQTEAIYQNKKY